MPDHLGRRHAYEFIARPQLHAVVKSAAAALMTLDYLKERAGRGSQAKFARVLATVKDRKPATGDDL